MPADLIPAAYANTDAPFVIAGKEGLLLLNDRPLNAETPPHLLDDEITPARRLFIRNNGIPPERAAPENWTLTIDGESVKSSKTYRLAELKKRFEPVSMQLTLESVSYTHLRAHETLRYLVCRLLLEKKNS